MRPLGGSGDIENALRSVGELLAAAGESYAIVILGGAALNLLGVVDRTTRDVDIVAFASRTGVRTESALEMPPKPFPEALANAIATVARDFGLDPGWLNTGPSLQMNAGLPTGFASRLEWRRFGALGVGIASRTDLITFKLFAAADSGPHSRHMHDLLRLRPTDEQLSTAAEWVKTQDANQHEFPRIVDQVVIHVRNERDAPHG